MDLNVLTGYVQATDLVYAGQLLQYVTTYGITGLTSGGFINIQNLMNAANSTLVLGQPPRETRTVARTWSTRHRYLVNQGVVVDEVRATPLRKLARWQADPSPAAPGGISACAAGP